MTTATTIIAEALMLIGQLAEGEEPSPEGSQSALRRLNSMVESMNNESLTIFQQQDEVFTFPAGVTYRTIGVGANFNTAWPIQILPSTFSRNSSVAPDVDFPLEVINQAQYNSIPVKDSTVTGPYPQLLYYDRAYPTGKLYIWPVLDSAVELHLCTQKQLASFAGLTTAVTLPPGYEEMLTFNLACRLAPSYGVTASADVKQYAGESRRNLKRANATNDVMSLPANLPGMNSGVGYWSFYRGGA